MHRRHLLLVWLPLFALVLPTARRASATPPDTTDVKSTTAAEATSVVEKQLVKPLTEKEARRSVFSRAYIPPQARRVRILDSARSTDGRGAEFVTFAVDESSGRRARPADDSGHWRKDVIVGCVYPARDEVFIKRGDKFVGASLLLGKKTAAADDTVCRPALARIPSSPPALATTSQIVVGSR